MKGSLIKKQVSFCKRNPTFMESVRLGAARAIDECQFQFRSRRWNCSTLDDSIGKKMDLITTSLNQLTAHHGNSESSNNHKGGGLNLHLPSGGGGGHGGFNPNNGLNPFSNPYMHNSMYRPNNYGNQQRSSNDRSSRQVQQAFNRRNDRNDRNVRRGRRLSRRARHGVNGSSNAHNDDSEVTNDTRMINNANPVQQTAPASQKLPSKPIASSSAPPSWRPPLNATSMMGPGIPLNSFEKYLPNLDHLNLNQNLDGDDDENEIGNNRKNNKNKNKNDKKRRKGKKGKRNKNKKGKDDKAIGPYPIVSSGTRESAFVHAISSAGVAHALTRACSSGDLENCGCDRSLRGMSPEGFQWSGCSDNVDFGITFSRTFVDARDRRKSRKNPRKAQPLMNLHNNEVGRKLLERNMKVECKCHGVSGSCELKTCWRSVASFRMIGEILKKKFDIAQEVRQRKRRGRRMLEPRFQRFKPHTDTDLVFLKESPTYCDFDINQGSLGTKGRECNPDGDGPESCDAMCCDRGHTTTKERRVERCKCKFHWCCFVQCEECYREVEVSTCN